MSQQPREEDRRPPENSSSFSKAGYISADAKEPIKEGTIDAQDQQRGTLDQSETST
jgi:hypothetical protein